MTIIALTAELAADRELLGGKAWSITEMLRHQIPVPPAFTLTTDECARYFDSGRTIPQDVLTQLPGAMRRLERETGRSFGSGEQPLLVSVRSGAARSMPGMMDTILNLGMTDQVQQALASGERQRSVRRRYPAAFSGAVRKGGRRACPRRAVGSVDGRDHGRIRVLALGSGDRLPK